MAENPSSVILFVINPVSGGMIKSGHEAAIKTHFEKLDYKVEFITLTGENDDIDINRAIFAMKPKKIVAVGGDGTVSLVAKQILGSEVEMGIIPAGSSNGMARDLNIPLNINLALKIISEGTSRKADIIEINGMVCLHLSDIGLNARMIKYYNEGNLRGKLGYAKVALKAIFRNQKLGVTIQCHEQVIKRNAFMVVLANATQYGTGAVINPQGNPYDGIFEVIVFRKLTLIELFRIFFFPKPFNPENIEVIKATSAIIETRKSGHFQIDGEYIGKVNRVMAKIHPAILNIIAPQ